MNGRVVCVVPAFDAAGTLGDVLRGVRQSVPWATVVVTDDGSRDATADVAERWADHVVRLRPNRGKGAALRAGFDCALALGAGAVLTLDADGQHDPACAPALLEALGDADVVIGARARRGSRMPMHRRLTNALSSAAVSRCAGCEVTDAQSGFRAVRADVLRRVRPAGNGYEFETEFLIGAGRAGFRIAAVPVPTIYGARSHFRYFRDAMLVIRTIWRSWRSRPEAAA